MQTIQLQLMPLLVVMRKFSAISLSPSLYRKTSARLRAPRAPARACRRCRRCSSCCGCRLNPRCSSPGRRCAGAARHDASAPPSWRNRSAWQEPWPWPWPWPSPLGRAHRPTHRCRHRPAWQEPWPWRWSRLWGGLISRMLGVQPLSWNHIDRYGSMFGGGALLASTLGGAVTASKADLGLLPVRPISTPRLCRRCPRRSR